MKQPKHTATWARATAVNPGLVTVLHRILTSRICRQQSRDGPKEVRQSVRALKQNVITFAVSRFAEGRTLLQGIARTGPSSFGSGRQVGTGAHTAIHQQHEHQPTLTRPHKLPQGPMPAKNINNTKRVQEQRRLMFQRNFIVFMLVEECPQSPPQQKIKPEFGLSVGSGAGLRLGLALGLTLGLGS